jgi:allantoinase
LQLRLPVVYTEIKRRGYTIVDLTRWLSSAPARLVGLEKRKGSIAVGHDADVIIWNPEQQFRVDGELLHHRHKLTPYQDRVLDGVVERTFLRGRKIYDSGEFIGEPSGRFLTTA